MITDTDCPICYEPMINSNNEDCCMNGDNCEHRICIPCYCKISVSENNKCPICRAILEGDSDDECDDIWNGNNERPINQLFSGRRWYNIETNKIEYYFVCLDIYGFNNSWTEIVKKDFPTFIARYLNVNEIEGCCYVCGIQKTPELNEFMKNKFPNGFVVNNDHTWDNYFIEGHNYCYECYYMYSKLNNEYYCHYI
jgi:hypothetical protein